MVLSMTPAERSNPRLMNGSRRSRIAQGAGVSVQDLNRFLREFETMEKMMKQVAKGSLARGLLKSLTSRAFS